MYKSSLGNNLPPALEGFEHVNRYWDSRMQLPAAKILPGECYVSNKGEMISTVLGSCISACIRDARIGIGGMNHFMLPIQEANGTSDTSVSNQAALSYGNWAMEYLINEILKQGGNKSNFEVKVFGGGMVLSSMSTINIGEKNVSFVFDFLEREGLSITSHDVGNTYPRKILYFPDTGAVKMKKLRQCDNDTVQVREKTYRESIAKNPSSNDVELF